MSGPRLGAVSNNRWSGGNDCWPRVVGLTVPPCITYVPQNAARLARPANTANSLVMNMPRHGSYPLALPTYPATSFDSFKTINCDCSRTYSRRMEWLFISISLAGSTCFLRDATLFTLCCSFEKVSRIIFRLLPRESDQEAALLSSRVFCLLPYCLLNGFGDKEAGVHTVDCSKVWKSCYVFFGQNRSCTRNHLDQRGGSDKFMNIFLELLNRDLVQVSNMIRRICPDICSTNSISHNHNVFVKFLKRKKLQYCEQRIRGVLFDISHPDELQDPKLHFFHFNDDIHVHVLCFCVAGKQQPS